MNLDDRQAIKLEEFYAFFRHVTSKEMPGWMDPVNRHQSDKLVMSAAQVHAQLKERAKQRYAGFILPSPHRPRSPPPPPSFSSPPSSSSSSSSFFFSSFLFLLLRLFLVLVLVVLLLPLHLLLISFYTFSFYHFVFVFFLYFQFSYIYNS